MVKKLIKHEFVYYLRTLTVLVPLMLLMGAMKMIVVHLTDHSGAAFSAITLTLDIARGSAYLMFAVTAFVMLLAPFFLGIVRFYKNMYSAEGYLTFTLPISNPQHIFVKLLVVIICELVCLLVVLAAFAISMIGQPVPLMLEFIWDALVLRFSEAPFDTVLSLLYHVLLALVGLVSAHLLSYACISIGQLAKKNRILLAIGAYFIYYVISQIFGTLLLIFFIFAVNSPTFDLLLNANVGWPWLFLRTVVLLFNVGLTALFYFITLHIMNKKLNLE